MLCSFTSSKSLYRIVWHLILSLAPLCSLRHDRFSSAFVFHVWQLIPKITQHNICSQSSKSSNQTRPVRSCCRFSDWAVDFWALGLFWNDQQPCRLQLVYNFGHIMRVCLWYMYTWSTKTLLALCALTTSTGSVGICQNLSWDVLWKITTSTSTRCILFYIQISFKPGNKKFDFNWALEFNQLLLLPSFSCCCCCYSSGLQAQTESYVQLMIHTCKEIKKKNWRTLSYKSFICVGFFGWADSEVKEGKKETCRNWLKPELTWCVVSWTVPWWVVCSVCVVCTDPAHCANPWCLTPHASLFFLHPAWTVRHCHIQQQQQQQLYAIITRDPLECKVQDWKSWTCTTIRMSCHEVLFVVVLSLR